MRLIILALAVLSASRSLAEEKPVEIPLKDVWASGMPGTRNIHQLDPTIAKELEKVPKDNRSNATAEVLAHRLKNESLVYQFFRKVDSLSEDKLPGKGFAVSALGHIALQSAAHACLGESPKTLPTGEVTLIFYAHQSGLPVHLKKVTRSQNKIDIHYVLGSRDVDVRTDQIALIPLGKLSPGTFDVEITTEHRQKRAAQKLAARQVCKSFSFIVEG